MYLYLKVVNGFLRVVTKEGEIIKGTIQIDVNQPANDLITCDTTFYPAGFLDQDNNILQKIDVNALP